MVNVQRVCEVAESDLGEGCKPEPDTRLLSEGQHKLIF